MIITSEQVGKGHPDKIADQISDLVLTLLLKIDPNSRVAIETLVGKRIVFITGEVTSRANIKYKKAVRHLLSKIDVSYSNFKIKINISKQSPEIGKKVYVSSNDKIFAGDQGLVYGYATNETSQLLPIPFVLATSLIKDYEYKLATNNGDYRFDSKSQVTFNYKTGKLVNVNFSVQHSANISLEKVKKDIKKLMLETIADFKIENNIKTPMYDRKTKFIINNGGTFILGGSMADSGLTGRKIIADTYGGWGRHGGGAFSGKDYTKIDRSACYYARYVARKIIEKNYADIVEIQVSYIIGLEKQVSLNIETFNTNKVNLNVIDKYLKTFDFNINNIIKVLDLKNIDYTKTTLYGHFGKDYLPWK